MTKSHLMGESPGYPVREKRIRFFINKKVKLVITSSCDFYNEFGGFYFEKSLIRDDHRFGSNARTNSVLLYS